MTKKTRCILLGIFKNKYILRQTKTPLNAVKTSDDRTLKIQKLW